MNYPLLVVITGPSGVGKDTLLVHLRTHLPGAHFAITATTREPRHGEQDGVDYYFYSVAEFEEMIERGDLLEHAVVYGDWKGVPGEPIVRALAAGKDVLMRTDVQGARHIKAVAPDAVTIFVAPPSTEELHRRLTERAADSEEQSAVRLKIADEEMAAAGEFDYTVVNDDIDHCAEEVAAILERERDVRTGRRYRLAETSPGHEWWQSGIIYQVYPRSYMDSDGDGVGDLAGITSRLDYIQSLGVAAIWISPIYPSPMADFGYDVSDYVGIHPLFGTLDDFDRLIAEARARNIRVILDYVPNHSSDQHPWFQESRSSLDNPKRDWYIWRHARPGGGPPNNWLSHFGGSAWEWDEDTKQYYYHAFLKEQPDLNWRNPKVQAAMMDVLRFWLDRGVDGFRVDVIWELIKDQQFRDNPVNDRYVEGEVRPYLQLLPLHNADQPEVHEVIRQMRSVVDEYKERVLIGEIYLPLDRLMRYYGENGPECHMPYNFSLVLLPWEASRIARSIEKYEHALPDGAWPNWVLGNHDVSRIATRADLAQAGVAAMLLLTLRGTPTMYAGDELGMENVPVPPEAQHDPVGKNIGPGFSRDPSRTPMQWDAGANAGFSSSEPWLPLGADHELLNVATLSQDPDSILSLYRRLIALRQSEPALSVGSYTSVPAEGDLLAYIREHEGRRFLIVLNLGPEPEKFELPDGDKLAQIVACTDRAREGTDVFEAVELRGNEGLVIEVSTTP